MSITLKDGTVLPDLPSDVKDQYPYTVILHLHTMIGQDTEDEIYAAFSVKAEAAYVPGEMIGEEWNFIVFGGEGASFTCDASNPTAWSEIELSKDPLSLPIGDMTVQTSEVVWSNYDIKTAATVDADTLGYTLGTEVYFKSCIFRLPDGTELPALPVGCFDKYPYGSISSETKDGSTSYILAATPTALVMVPVALAKLADAFMSPGTGCHMWRCNDGSWIDEGDDETVGFTIPLVEESEFLPGYSALWFNHDVLIATGYDAETATVTSVSTDLYRKSDVNYRVHGGLMKSYANQARRLGGVTDGLSTSEIEDIFRGIDTEELTVTPTAEAQSHTPSDGKIGFSKVDVAAAPLEEVTVTHEFIQNTETEYQVIEPSDGQYGIGKVNVPKVKLAYMIESEMSSDKEKTFTFKPPEGYDGIGTASVTVTYTGAPTLQTKAVTPTTAAQIITADEGYEGLSIVNVAAAPTETLNVTPTTAEQTFTPSSGKVGFSQVTVAAAEAAEDPVYQEKTVTPTTEEQVITADEGYDALSKVTVKAAESGGVEYQSVMEVSF